MISDETMGSGELGITRETRGVTICLVWAIHWAINDIKTRWLTNWVLCLFSNKLNDTRVVDFGTIRDVTMVLLGHHTFLLEDWDCAWLRIISLHLFAQAEEVVLFGNSTLYDGRLNFESHVCGTLMTHLNLLCKSITCITIQNYELREMMAMG